MCMSIHVNGVLHQPEEGAGSAGAAAAGTVWFTQRLAGLTHQERYSEDCQTYFLLCLSETGLLCVTLDVLELALKASLASNSEIYLPRLLEAGIEGVCHHTC